MFVPSAKYTIHSCAACACKSRTPARMSLGPSKKTMTRPRRRRALRLLSPPPPTQRKPKASCQASASANSLQGHHHTSLYHTFRLAEAASVGPLSILVGDGASSSSHSFREILPNKASKHTAQLFCTRSSTLSVQQHRAGPFTHSALCLHPFSTHRSALAFFSEGSFVTTQHRKVRIFGVACVCICSLVFRCMFSGLWCAGTC